MKFYNVRVGKETRKGGFIEYHSFVCKTENADMFYVRNHWVKHYSGMDISVSEVVNIVEAKIEVNNDYLKEEKQEIKDLRKEIKSLKEQLKPEKSERLFSSLSKEYFPRKVKENIEIIQQNETEIHKLKKESAEILTKSIEQMNSKICHWARADKGFESDYSSFSYEIYIKGQLVKEYETEK